MFDQFTVWTKQKKTCQHLLFFIVSEFQKYWRSVAVEGLDEAKIEEYLTRNGISSMQDAGVRKVVSILLYFRSIHIALGRLIRK